MRALERMLRWAGCHGGRISLVRVCDRGREECDVAARTAIGEGDAVLTVPRSLVLTTKDARTSAIGEAILRSGMVPRSRHTMLAAWLLQEKHAKRSFWYPYLASLPASFPNVPLFFGREDLELLEGTLALQLAYERRAMLVDEYRELRVRVPAFARFPLHDFVWASTVVRTRVFSILLYGERTDALVPVADMLDHSPLPRVSWRFDDDREAFVVTAGAGFAAGDAIHDSYGSKSNSRYLVGYGFVVEGNAHDEALLRFESGDVRVPADLADDRVQELFSSLRARFAGDEQQVLSAIRSAARDGLSRFATSVEEDDALLNGNGLTLNARNAIIVRSGEKRVLSIYRELGLS
jgi:histone-lysine N-methyltransferase SETD3